MSRLLDLDEWRAENIAYCPTCETDTMPLSTGRCGFCDRRLIDPTVGAKDEPNLGVCLYESCGMVFERGSHGGKMKEYCCEKHRMAAWYETPKGRAWLEVSRERANERKRAKRAAWRAAGLNSRGLPRRAS